MLQTMAAERPGATDELSFFAPRAREARLRARKLPAAAQPDRAIFLRRQGGVLMICASLGLLCAAAYVTLSPPQYRAAARLLIDPRAPGEADMRLLDAENRRYVIVSRPLLAEAIKRGHLDDSPFFGNARPGTLGRMLALLTPPEPQDREDKAIGALADAVGVVSGERADVLDIVVTTGDPQVAADTANLLANVYLEQERETRDEAAKRASDALTERANKLAREAEQAAEEAETFRLQNNLSSGALQAGDAPSPLAKAKARTAAAQAHVDQLEQMAKARLDPSRIPQALQSPAMSELRTQYQELAQQEAGYAMQFGPKHPALLQVRARLQDVRNLIAAEFARMTQAARSELASAKASEAALAHSAAAAPQETADNSSGLARLRELERAAEAKKSLYQFVLARQKALDERQGIEATRILAEATPAMRPSGAPAALILGTGALLGLVAGAGIGVARERGRRGRQSIADLEILLGAPFLGCFPPARSDTRAGAEPRRHHHIGENLLRLGDGSVPRIIGLLGLHKDELRARLLAALAGAAREARLVVGFIEGDPRANRPAAMPLADLLLEERGRLSLRCLRGKLCDYADGKDLVFLNMPAVLDVGMPPVLLEAVDALVLQIAERDITREKIAKLAAFVGRSGTTVAGFVVTSA